MSTELFTELNINFDSTFEKGGAKSTTETQENFGSTFLKGGKGENDGNESIENFGSTFLKGGNESIENFGSTFPKGGFGLLTLKAALSSMTTEELELLFEVDNSGSMSDMCSDGRTKMQHILHTLKNMILFFKENPSLNVHISIHSFDDNICEVVSRTQVNDTTCNQILAKIDTIHPHNSTDIENALDDVNKYFSSLTTDCKKVSILMTDGMPTSGNTSSKFLRKCVNDSITNIFIGFGLDHDAKLLKTISSGENSSYYFIDKLENAGLVYGEILHGLIYKFLERVQISVTNGVIYDYSTNTWTSTLYVGNIVSEAKKFYQLTSETPSECVVQVTGYQVENGSEFTAIVPVQEERIDLTNYMYRQRTQEMLFKVNDFNNNEETQYKDYIEKQKALKALRKELHDFFEELKKYMEDNQLKDNILLKNLCDDIYICYRTFGTNYGFMYCAARECSQGQQRAYTATQLPDDIQETQNQHVFGGIRRQHAIIDEDTCPTLQHDVSIGTQTPYRSKTITGVMRSCSAGVNVDLEEAEQTQEM